MAGVGWRGVADDSGHGDATVQVYVSAAAPSRGGIGLTPTIT